MKRLVDLMDSYFPDGQSLHVLIPVLFLLFLILPSTGSATDPQGTWVILNSPTDQHLRKLSFLDNLTGWVSGDSGTILKTTDGAETWVQQLSPVDFPIDEIKMVNSELGWAIGQDYPQDTASVWGTTLIRTTNGGENWFVQNSFSQQFYHSMDFVDSVTGFLGQDMGRILKTTDGGVSWEPTVIDSPSFAMWPIFTIKFLTRNYGYASGGLFDITGLIWKTTDGGNFWTHQRVAGEPVFGIHDLDSMNIVCVGGDLDYGAGLIRSSDAGTSWEYTYLGIWGQGTAVDFRTPTEGWAPLGFARTFMYSLDSGRTWTAIYTPDTSAMYDVVFTDSSTGYMVGDFGAVYKYELPVLAAGEPANTIPDRSVLLQNYPNPFNPTTEISFQLTAVSQASLVVYDLLGREVATLVNEKLPPGDYERSFDGDGLASGIYLCRIRVEPVDRSPGYHRTMKMLLMK